MLPTADIVSAYFEFCREEDWLPLSMGRVYRELPDIMMELFGSSLGNARRGREGRRLKGYPKVALQPRGGAEEIELEGIPRA